MSLGRRSRRTPESAVSAQVSWSPTNPQRCQGSTLTVTYSSNEGPLEGVDPVYIGFNTNGAFHGRFIQNYFNMDGNPDNNNYKVFSERTMTVTVTSTAATQTHYFRAYPMTDKGDDTYSHTLTINKTGAYRVTVRYKVNGQTYYYTDKGLRRHSRVQTS